MANPELSVIVPVYNEAAALPHFFKKIQSVLNGLSYEIICVNDGSTDETADLLACYAQTDSRIKVVSFSRNFKKEAALFAGLKYAVGRAVVPIDADLQDPPEVILDFLDKWHAGFKVVYGVRQDRSADSFLKKGSAQLFYKIYNLFADRPIPYNAGDFRLLDRQVVDAVLQTNERNLFMKGLFNWVGFKSCPVYYKRQTRSAGCSTWNYWRLWNFALDGLTATTTFPLRIWLYIGGFAALFSVGYAAYIIIRTLIFGVDLPGYASLLVFMLFLGSIQLMALGVMGEYLGRIFNEVKHRPRYIVSETQNITAPLASVHNDTDRKQPAFLKTTSRKIAKKTRKKTSPRRKKSS